jgi:hypothetical protein
MNARLLHARLMGVKNNQRTILEMPQPVN